MMRDLFGPGFAELPDSLPIFPLPGALLLPGGNLPLNIFEPRYLAMVRDTLAWPRLIGMVQPKLPAGAEDEDYGEDVGAAAVYQTGCAGRIAIFQENSDGRCQITLAGLVRFRITEEIAGVDGYRRVRPDWSDFAADFTTQSLPETFERQRLLTILQDYFHLTGLSADWSSIEAAPAERLVTSLSMICPFDPREKQALLEAPDMAKRGETLITILEMAVMEARSGVGRH
ncbi:LON peptidase substrate-binding domain-containing protein [Fodinicurvata halophila]|uniref:LON peptidase substrate-binding domain-containing protein n=1 Tax=Fodinicurvata halophila TaxID=1419723 RepID=A0ABV8UKU2_9PROT